MALLYLVNEGSRFLLKRNTVLVQWGENLLFFCVLFGSGRGHSENVGIHSVDVVKSWHGAYSTTINYEFNQWKSTMKPLVDFTQLPHVEVPPICPGWGVKQMWFSIFSPGFQIRRPHLYVVTSCISVVRTQSPWARHKCVQEAFTIDQNQPAESNQDGLLWDVLIPFSCQLPDSFWGIATTICTGAATWENEGGSGTKSQFTTSNLMYYI